MMYNVGMSKVIAIKTVQWDAFNPSHECCGKVVAEKFKKLMVKADGGAIWQSKTCMTCGKHWHIVKGGSQPADNPQHIFIKEFESNRDVPLGWKIID